MRRAPTRAASRGLIRLAPSPLGLLAILLIVAALHPTPARTQATGSVRGEVRSEGTGAALPGAIVALVGPAGATSSLTDTEGRYELLTAPAGRSILRVRYLGHDPLELQIVVPPGDVVTVDFWLTTRPVPLDPVQVGAAGPGRSGEQAEAAGDPELGIAGAHALGSSPGLAEIGLGNAGQADPDRGPGDPGSILYVRGAAADLKLVYLDGAPVYAPFPLGGLLDPFTPGVLSRADIYLGGAPARYDGGLSYVMDLRSRPGVGHGVRTEGALDMLSGRVLAEAGIANRVRVLTTARGIHGGASAGILGEPLPYGYREGFVRADANLGEASTLRFSGFTNAEEVGMGGSASADSTIAWGNDSGSLQLRTAIGGVSAEITGAVGDYSARLPLPGDEPMVAEGTARRSRLAADLSVSDGGRVFRFGASVDAQRYRAVGSRPQDGSVVAISHGAGQVAGVYAEGAGPIAERLHLRAGARVDHFSTTGDVTLGPRIAVTWMVTDRAALTVAAGRYHQFLRPPDETLLSSAAEPSIVVGAPLAVGSASHVAIGLDQDLGEGVRLGVEGFYKHFSDVPGALTIGANASGVDLWARRSAGRWNGWLGYSLAWVWSTGGLDRPAEFTGRHLLTSGFATSLGGSTAIDFRFAYGAGLPYSPIRVDPSSEQTFRTTGNFTTDATPELMAANRGGTETAPLLQAPDRPFLRLDASISQRWNPRIRGRPTEFRPYLKLLNGLGRRDALFYYADGGEDDNLRQIGRLPVLPVAGLEWRF